MLWVLKRNLSMRATKTIIKTDKKNSQFYAKSFAYFDLCMEHKKHKILNKIYTIILNLFNTFFMFHMKAFITMTLLFIYFSNFDIPIRSYKHMILLIINFIRTQLQVSRLLYWPESKGLRLIQQFKDMLLGQYMIP